MEAFRNIQIYIYINSNSFYSSDDVGYVIFMNACMSFRNQLQQMFSNTTYIGGLFSITKICFII